MKYAWWAGELVSRWAGEHGEDGEHSEHGEHGENGEDGEHGEHGELVSTVSTVNWWAQWAGENVHSMGPYTQVHAQLVYVRIWWTFSLDVY